MERAKVMKGVEGRIVEKSVGGYGKILGGVVG